MSPTTQSETVTCPACQHAFGIRAGGAKLVECRRCEALFDAEQVSRPTPQAAPARTSDSSSPADETAGCVGTCIMLVDGSYLDLQRPDPQVITIESIALGLARICRFGGQIREWYSVAEHSLWCERLAEADRHEVAVRRAVLLHDAAEAFIGDVVRPLKQLLPQYRAIEARLQAAIHQRFDVTVDNATHRIIREIDNAILKAEREQLFADLPPHDWSSLRGVRAIGLDLTSDVFIRSREQFLAAAERLGVR